jgi:hypothetical protein
MPSKSSPEFTALRKVQQLSRDQDQLLRQRFYRQDHFVSHIFGIGGMRHTLKDLDFEYKPASSRGTSQKIDDGRSYITGVLGNQVNLRQFCTDKFSGLAGNNGV